MWNKPRCSAALKLTVKVFCLCRGVSVLDVEGFDFPFAISLFWSRKYHFFFFSLVIAQACAYRIVLHRRAPLLRNVFKGGCELWRKMCTKVNGTAVL